MNDSQPSTALEIRHLRLLSALAASGTLTRAAGELHLTQSALSHQLKDLESRLGTALFDRRPRQMTLTPAGERILAVARDVLKRLADAESDIRTLGARRPEPLRISTSCYTCYHWLPGRLSEFSRLFPVVDVQIAADYTRQPVRGLLNGELDLAITSDRVKNARLHSTPLFEDELVALLPSGHRLAARTHLDPKTLTTETLLVYNLPVEQLGVFQDVLTPMGIKPAEVKRIELTEAIIELVRAGFGIAILARWAVQPHLKDGQLKALRFTRRGLKRQWSAVVRRRDWEIPHVAEFVRILRQTSF